MRVVNIKDIKDDTIFQKMDVINGVTFLESEQCKEVLESAKGDINTLEKWFNTINIRYDELKIIGSSIVYSLKGKELSLSDLSSGERYILYLIACKYLHKEIIAQGLFERLGSKLEEIAINQLKDYKELTVVVYNNMPISLEYSEVKY